MSTSRKATRRAALAVASLLAALAAAGPRAAAQSVQAKATIDEGVTTQVLGVLAFGTFAPGAAQTIAASGSAAAQVQVSYNASTVDLSIPATVTLTRSGGGTLQVTLACAGAYSQNAAATTACTNNAYRFTYAEGNGSASQLAQGWFYIGGTIPSTASAGARAGTYTGTISITTTNSGN
jgi:hypothetical protein